MTAATKASLRAFIYLDPENGRQKERVCVVLKMKRQEKEECSSIDEIAINDRRVPYEMKDNSFSCLVPSPLLFNLSPLSSPFLPPSLLFPPLLSSQRTSLSEVKTAADGSRQQLPKTLHSMNAYLGYGHTLTHTF